MSHATPACPYCNTLVPAPSGGSAGRLRCPRCDETFPYRAGEEAGVTTAPPVAPTPSLNLAGRRSKLTNKAVLGIVLSVMASMALLSLVFALETREQRRQRDNPAAEPTAPAPVVAAPPARLAALDYLPSGTSVVAGLHVAEVLRTEAGREAVERFWPGGLERMPRWTGLTRDQIDHLVVGVKLDNLAVVFVAHARGRIDPQAVTAALKAREVKAKDRKTYRFQLGESQFQAVLWFADERTLVTALAPEHLDLVPLKPEPGAERLAPGARDVVQRLEKDTPAWAAVQVAGQPALWQVFLPAGERERLGKLHSLGLWLNLEPGPKMHGLLQANNPEGAAALAAYFKELKEPQTINPWREKLPYNVGRILQALAPQLEVTQKGSEVRLGCDAGPEAFRRK